MRRTVFVLGTALLLGACGGGGSSPASSSAASAPSPARGSANLITEGEVRAANVSNALEAIQRLRPSMLRTRSGVTTGEEGNYLVVVYVDGVRMGGPEMLANVTALAVREIRFISATDATQRFGTNHPLGAILVATRR